MKKTIISIILALSIFMSLAVVSYAVDGTTTVTIETTVAVVTDETSVPDSDETTATLDETTAFTSDGTSETVINEDETQTVPLAEEVTPTVINAVVTVENSEEDGITEADVDGEAIPQTGEKSRIAPAVITIMVSAAFIALIMLKKRKAPEKASVEETDNENKGE